MTADAFSLGFLCDPQSFAVNQLDPVSDHTCRDGSGAPIVRSLAGTWRMHYAVCPAGAPRDYWREGFDDSGFDAVAVPGHIQLQGYDRPHYVNVQYPWDGLEDLHGGAVSDTYNPTASYALRFTLTAAEERAARLVLTLEGAESAAAVWLNGVFIGYGEDGFTPARYDVTKAARPGENRLCVQVFKRCTGTWLEDQDFWRLSGIFRDVTLTAEPAAHVADLFVKTPLADDFSAGALDCELRLDLPEERTTVELALLDASGRKVGETVQEAAPMLALSLPVAAPHLWSAEDPYLYRLTVTLKNAAGETAETAEQDVGFRRFELKDRIMTLNGKRIVFHGVNRHEFHCDRGRVLTEADMLADIRLMKRMHVNAVRTCHYPNDPRWYRLCDRYGLYLIDEANIESHGSWAQHGRLTAQEALPGDRPEWLGCILRRGCAMQERDKNHPSVLIWSCGNESHGGKDLFELSELLRRRDSTRLIHYEGIANDGRYPATSDMYSRMYLPPDEIEKYLAGDPAKPFINCEYTHAMGNSCGGMSLYAALEDKWPMYQGGFIWDFVDQALRVQTPWGATRQAYGGDFGDQPTDYHFNTNGILLGDRTETPKVQEVRHLFGPAALTVGEGAVTIQNRLLFTDLADRYDLSWTMTLDGEPCDQGRAYLPSIAPGERAVVELPAEVPDEPGEAVLTCTLIQKAEDPFFARGEEAAFGQAILRAAEPAVPAAPCATALVRGGYNAGLNSPKMRALLSYPYGGLVSLKNADGKELLLRAPKLSLFRAPTDNDRGCGDNVRQGVWHALSENSAASTPEITLSEGLLTAAYRFTTPILPDAAVTVTYRIGADDSLTVTVAWPGVQGQPDLPALGLSFLLDPSLTHVRYYGMGPMENYADRCTGARLGRFAYERDENLTRYCKPQECGSRMGVRSLTVTDDSGAGVVVEAQGQPLEISVLPYTAEQLEQVWHPDELGPATRTVLDVALMRKGVGGDDSWGAHVHPEYCYPSDKPYRFSFQLKVL